MPPVLSPVILFMADRGHLLRTLSTFSGRGAQEWLGPHHPARTGQLQRSWPDVAALPAQRLIEAVAASGPNHCIDGWSYISRAIASILAGDVHAARHLAYYAQLRAGLCMLAHVGVGVFNRINFVIDVAGAIHRLDPVVGGPATARGLGTHEVVWQALMKWVQEPTTARLFLDLVKIRGVALRECLEAIWPGLSIASVASSMIHAWGLDLKRGKDEHLNRNISSYAPQALNPISVSTADVLAFVNGLWQLLEPSSGASLDKLDRSLLRALLWRQHRLVAQNSHYSTGAIASRYDDLPASIRSIASKEFLIGADEPLQPELLRKARSVSKPAGPLEMISRAVLLLRAASAFTHTSFVEAGVSGSAGDLRPWLDEFAQARGFWSPGAPVLDPIDLWTDVELGLLDLTDSREPAPVSLHDWLRRSAKGLPTICETERVGIWSLSS